MGILGRLNPREKEASFDLMAFSDATGRSGWLDIGGFPTGSIQVYKDDAATMAVDIEISNIPSDDHAEVLSADVAANTVVAITKGARYLQVNFKTLTNGKAGATYVGQPQS